MPSNSQCQAIRCEHGVSTLIAGAQSSVDAMGSRVAAVDAVHAADRGGGGAGGGGGGGHGAGGQHDLGSIAEEGGEDEASGGGGGGGGSGSFSSRQDGRATVVEKPDGMVEITEVYDDGEALEEFQTLTLDPKPEAGAEAQEAGAGAGAGAAAGAGAGAGAGAAAGAEAGAGGTGKSELDDVFARLEALEAGEKDGGDTMEEEENEDEDDPDPDDDDRGKDDDDEEDEEYEEEEEEEEEEAGFASSGMIASPADMFSFERWKAKQQQDGYDVGQNAEHPLSSQRLTSEQQRGKHEYLVGRL
jgi:hypothetical protein